jgi:hypothetical protein
MDGIDARVMRWKVALSFIGEAEILGLVSLSRVVFI